MPELARQPAGNAPRQEGAKDGGLKDKIFRLIQQALIIYLVSSVAKNYLSPASKGPAVTPVPVDAPADSVAHASPDGIDPFKLPPQKLAPLWPVGSVLDMHVRVSSSGYDPHAPQVTAMDKGLPSFVWRDIHFGNWSDERVEDFVMDVPNPVQHNSSLWLHVYLANQHANPNPHSHGFNIDNVYHFRKPLTRYLKKPKVHIEKNLLTGETDEEVARKQAESDKETEIWLSYWHPNVTLTLVSDPGVLPAAQVAAPMAPFYTTHPTKRDATGTTGFYYPVIFPNDFWLLRSQMSPINTTTPTLPLRITYHAISMMKFQMFASFSQGFDQAANKGGGATTADLDEIKRMLIETSPWLLITTAIVSILHMLFEMLAFSSDIAHWRKKDELVGVSLRSIIVNVFVQTITGLYLWDNAEETSWMILFSSAIGVLIEAWKITKAVDVALIPSTAGSLLPYQIKITDKHILSEDEKKTKEFDALAFRYVSYVAIPTLAIYTGYSLKYQTHKGWYSFIITTLSSFVYMFGFVQLVPQLIINYKLKSVAHMPWKAMVYKTLSTVVDDFFAFIIKMPWLHRLACFRDDLVFLILLYQRWIYRIDYKRANEYGQIAAEVVEAEDAKTVEGVNKTE